MKKVLTIDFDILMHQSINIYNDYDNDVNEFLLDFPFINQLPIDLELYENLTNFLLQIPKNKIVFIKDHDEIVKLTRNEGPFTLINLDHHHDLGYGDNIRWNIPVKQVDVGNWVKKLWDLNRVNKYIWLKDNNSYDPPSRAQKYLTEKHFFNNYNFDNLLDVDKVYIALSLDWIPYEYQSLYRIWEQFFKEDSSVNMLSLKEVETSEQLSFDLI